MRIKSFVQAGSILWGLIVVAACGVLFVTLNNLNHASKKHTVVHEIQESIFELTLLTNDYVLYREQRALAQWREKHRFLARLLDQPNTGWSDTDQAIKTLSRPHTDLEETFGRLIAYLNESDSESVSRNIADTYMRNLISQVLGRAQRMDAAAQEMARESQAELDAALNRVVWIILLVGASIGVTIALTWTLLGASILLPIKRLQEGVSEVKTGNLNYRIQLEERNEIGELAESFDRMTEQLQATLASRAELNREVEQRKRAAEQLARAATELERSNQELQQFAYVASHDLQEPLRMVTSYLQLLQRRYQGKLDADADEFIGYAVDGAQRMKTLILDLLTYSRVGSRGKPLAPVALEAALADVLSNLQEAVRESGAQISHDPLPEVWADLGQMRQLLQNLIGNALKFHGDAAPQVHLSAAPDPDGWRLTVRDHGIGIDSEFFERIFVVFQRLHTRDEYAGTGIGLAVCKKIVERHGGRIWVESTPGQGAAFCFTLPAVAG
ncbi:MAG: ATP-binding protein [Candidatus Competibacter sp.]|nr:ATP-binding protein [Candidatus Competibacter sp.]MDG4584967.1 ATP-binding protein [Candidatus Competibacter sp.]